MQKITANLWFKGNAEEAIKFYLSVFPDLLKKPGAWEKLLNMKKVVISEF